MSADFKSHVLRRDEKGFFGIPFKRLLLAGVSGGLLYTVVRLLLPSWALVLGLIMAAVTLILTAPQGGLPLWQRHWYGLRSRLMAATTTQPTGLGSHLARLLELPVTGLMLNADHVFADARSLPTEVDMREWVMFARTAHADPDDGLIFVDPPSVAERHV